MIIVRLIGGLGNQMFQYAAGRSLASRLGTELKLDVSGFNGYRGKSAIVYREYMLGNYCVRENFCLDEDKKIFNFDKPYKNKYLFHLKRILSEKQSSLYFEEKHFHYDKTFEFLDGNIYLAGYWNSERYFENHAELVRHDFRLKQQPSAQNASLLERILECNSVAVHVRRGDYVANLKTNRVHGVCDLSYYRRCVDYLAARVERPHFFIFSDDPVWVRAHFNINFPTTVVDHNGSLASHEDLRLMSHCRHQIIANSTFSWWGAWLNDYDKKIVLAPQRWFAVRKYDTSSLLPHNWLMI